MGRSAPQAADTTAAEKGGSLCTTNPVNPGDFRVPSMAMQRVMWLGGRDEPERGSGQGQRKPIPPQPSCFSRGELPSRGDSSHQARTANTKRHVRPLKILPLSGNNEAVHGGHDFPPRPSFGSPSPAKPTEKIQNRDSPEDGTKEHVRGFSSTARAPAGCPCQRGRKLQHGLETSGEKRVRDFKEEK